MKHTALIALLTASLAGTSLAQTDEKIAPEKAAILALDREYEAAFARGDAGALTAFFAEDAEHTTEDGRILRGRAAIQEAISEGIKSNKGAKLAILLDSVQALTPDVVAEKGVSTVTSKGGGSSTSAYTAIYVKKDDKWKISQLIETPLPVPTAGERLEELAWMIGKWEEANKTDDMIVESEYKWARGGSFITRNVTVKRAGETELEGWQIIGWDPLAEGIRSWTFDSEGGFSEGSWTRDRDSWLVREIGVASDGSRTAGDQTVRKLGSDRFSWESNNRTLNGDPQPGIGRIEINRVKGN